RLARVLDHLLEAPRFMAAGIPLELEDLDLADVVRAAIERTGASEVCADLLVDVEPVTGRWNRARVEHVASAIVSKAIEHGKRRPVGIVLAGDADHAILRVVDRGAP